MNNYEEQDYSKQKFNISVWKKIIKLVLKNKGSLILMIISVLGLAFLDIIYPLMNAYAIKTFFEGGDFTKQTAFLIGYGFIAIGYGVTVFGFIRMAGKVEVEVGYEIRKEAFHKLQELSFGYYDKTPAGWIMARLTSDSRRLASIISWGIVDMLWGATTMTGILIVIYIVEWRLALIITVLIPLLLVISIYFRKKILTAYRSVRKINSKITASYNEGIMGNKTSKSLVLEDYNSDEFDKLATNMKRKSIRAIIFSSLFFPILLVVSYVAILATLRIGGDMVINGVNSIFGVALTVSTLYLFINYTLQFFEPVMQIARILAELQQAQASAERIMSLIEEKPQIYDSEEVVLKYGNILNPKFENYGTITGDVRFENVTFSYLKDEIILDNFNLDIKAGTSVALVGETGSGKSTIVNLVCRFYEPSEGNIYIDGQDYKDYSIGYLHSNLGYVLQTPHLFNLSIADNIKYGRKMATMEEVKEAARIVGADFFIEKLDKGYETFVGEEGAMLSVGERQLISFARALIVNPKILVLDEATSSIDTKTEEAIQKAIKEVMKGRTTFMVAHRLSTVIDADIILVIDQGKIIEKGNHTELLQLKGTYYELYRNQFVNEQLLKSAK